MIDLSDLKAPGWGRVVAELASAAPDDRAYFERMLRVLAQVSAARVAALMLADRPAGDGEEIEPRVVSVWPSAGPVAGGGARGRAGAAAGNGNGSEGGGGNGEAQLENAKEMKDAARAAFSSAQARAFGLEKGSDQYYGAGSTAGFVVAVPLKNAAGVPVAVISMLVEARSKDALRSTLAMAEVLAGYVHGQAARGALRETQKASFALDLATRLIASINQAEGFKGATMQICNDLQRQFAVDRVGLGWVKGDRTKLTALSDTENLDRRMAMVQKIEAAMDECLDQDQPILYPPPAEASGGGAASGDGELGEGGTSEGDVLLSQAIVHSHRELAAGTANLRIASLPLRVDDDVVGVLTIESTGDGDISLGTIEMLQAAMDLISPVLKIRRSDDRMLPLRAWDSTMKSAAWAVGPKHTAWKLFAIGLVGAVAFLSLYKTEYLVTAEAMVRPATQAVVSMPREGVIEALGPGVKINARVEKGDVLVLLDRSELELAAIEAEAKIMQAEAQAAAARAEGEEAAATRAELEAAGYRAQLDGLRYRIDQSTIVAPIDGTILEGDLEERIGSTMALGDPLMVIASVAEKDDLIIVARVDERDIGLVSGVHRPGDEVFAAGTLASKTKPNLRHELRVKDNGILPVARAEEGKNIFEVRAEIVAFDEDGSEQLMPGMEGLARFRTERHSLMWIGTRRVVDMVRLWLWK